MNYKNNKAENVKIAYIGGGSRGWAWGLMSDLAGVKDMSGEVALYDIDFEAAKNNEIIGNKFNDLPDCVSKWTYKATETIGEALSGAQFVVISILPGTFKEMESDVHTPEKYGIYQSVGDTSGPGGIVRALRTLPMMEKIALAVKEYAPEAWVINYTNPMTLCIKALYYTFPQIKAFGCCHEVFGTQSLLIQALKEFEGIEEAKREDINVNVVGVNHFTWLTKAQYKNIDLFDVYAKFAEKYAECGCAEQADVNWLNSHFHTGEKVKIDLFRRYGYMAAAGDRHLAEFCPADWYLKDPDTAHGWQFGLTPVSWRWDDLEKRLEKSKKLISGEEELKINKTGEEGVNQMRAILGLTNLVTNVNIPNYGQIPNLPIGAVVETNAIFRANSVVPVMAGEIPDEIFPLISRVSGEQEIMARACRERDLELAFKAFANDPLITISHIEARKLFKEMIENTKEYLGEYNVEGFKL